MSLQLFKDAIASAFTRNRLLRALLARARSVVESIGFVSSRRSTGQLRTESHKYLSLSVEETSSSPPPSSCVTLVQ